MTNRGELSRKSTFFLLLMATVSADGLRGAAQASDQAAQNYLRSLTRASDGPEITGTVNARTALPAGHASLTVVASHARAARAVFGAARAAMERGFLLGETAPKSNIAVLEAAMKELNDHLAIVANAPKPRSADGVRLASSLAQDWYEAGLKIIKPPVEGVTELPSPMSVHSKADAVGAALDRVIEEVVASAPRPAPKRKAQPASRVAADAMDPAGLVGRSREMHF